MKNPFEREIERKVEHAGEWYARTAAGEWLRWDDDAADWAPAGELPAGFWDAPAAKPPEEPTVTGLVTPVVLRGILWVVLGGALFYTVLVLLVTSVFPGTNDGRVSFWGFVAIIPGLIFGVLIAGASLWVRTKRREVLMRQASAWEEREAEERGGRAKRTGRLPE